MVPQGHGRIINTASIGGLRGAADGASYTASKFGVVGLTRQIACTYAENGITINRSEEHTSELQSLMRISYAVFCLKQKTKQKTTHNSNTEQQRIKEHTT